MLSNAYFLANFRFDTAEKEPAKKLQNFANFPNFAIPLSYKVDKFADAQGALPEPARSGVPPRNGLQGRAK